LGIGAGGVRTYNCKCKDCTSPQTPNWMIVPSRNVRFCRPHRDGLPLFRTGRTRGDTDSALVAEKLQHVSHHSRSVSMIWCLKKQRLRNPCVVTRNRSYVCDAGFFIRTAPRPAWLYIFVPSAVRRAPHAEAAALASSKRAALDGERARCARRGTHALACARRATHALARRCALRARHARHVLRVLARNWCLLPVERRGSRRLHYRHASNRRNQFRQAQCVLRQLRGVVLRLSTAVHACLLVGQLARTVGRVKPHSS